MISIDKSLNGQKITTKNGDILKVQLAENPTTGCLWKINSHDKKHIKFTKDEFQISEQSIGAGGMKTFLFKVKNEGTSKLELTFGNPWEKDTIETFEITIESSNSYAKKKKLPLI